MTHMTMRKASRMATPLQSLVSGLSKMAQSLSKLETHGVKKPTKASLATKTTKHGRRKSRKKSVMFRLMMASITSSSQST